MSHTRRTRPSAPLALRLLLVLLSLAVAILAGCGTTVHVKAVPLPTATHTPITVSVDRTTYNIAQAIGVTVKNTGTTTVYATDTSFACTIVLLQRFDTKTHTWKTLNSCGPGHSTSAYSLPSGIAEPFTLPPQSRAKPSAWQTGTYRVGVRYSTSSDGMSHPTYAYSAGFSIT